MVCGVGGCATLSRPPLLVGAATVVSAVSVVVKKASKYGGCGYDGDRSRLEEHAGANAGRGLFMTGARHRIQVAFWEGFQKSL